MEQEQLPIHPLLWTRCPNCNEFALINAKTCPSCGYDFTIVRPTQMNTCPNCGARSTMNVRVCSFCGHRFGAVGKARRIGRILAYLLVTLLIVFIVYGRYFSGGSF